jgi:uncharacterized protein (TIRG00374 family)
MSALQPNLSVVPETKPANPASRSDAIRKIAGVAVKIAVSLALLAYLLWTQDLRAIAQRISGADDLLLIGAVGLYVFMLVVSVWRWRILLTAQGHVAPMTHLSASYLVATFFNNFLPGNIGGDLIRVRDSSRLTGSTMAAIAIIAIDRIIGFGALYALAVTAYVFGGPEVRALTGARVVLGGLTVVFAVLAYIFFLPGTARRLLSLSGLDKLDWVRTQFETVQAAVRVYRQEQGALWLAFGASVALQISVVWYYFAIARALHISLAVTACFLMVPLCILAQTLPVSFNGWGVREGVFIHYFHQVGLPKDQATAFSIVGASLIVLLSMSGAVVFMARGKSSPATAEAD